MKYIIVILDDEETEDGAGLELATRQQFESYEAAKNHSKFYAESVQLRTFIVRCPKGLTYD